jgi:hypothetical protein
MNKDLIPSDDTLPYCSVVLRIATQTTAAHTHVRALVGEASQSLQTYTEANDLKRSKPVTGRKLFAIFNLGTRPYPSRET